MRRSLSFLAAFTLAASLAGTAGAAQQCRDASGKFVKCPAAASSGQCRDASGKFVKCGTPGAVPAGKSSTAKAGGTTAEKSKSATSSASNASAKPKSTTTKTTKKATNSTAGTAAPH